MGSHMKTHHPAAAQAPRCLLSILATCFASITTLAAEPAIDPASLRLSSDVPVIGAWFPQSPEMADPEGYKDFLDAAAMHSTYTILTTTKRNPGRQMTDPDVHDWFKRAAAYAKERGMGVALELDVRHSWKDYLETYPDAIQQRLWLNEVALKADAPVTAEFTYKQPHGDAIMGPGVTEGTLERVFSYVPSPQGVKAGSLHDITEACKLTWIEGSSFSVTLPPDARKEGRKACVITRLSFNYPDVFSPELLQFEADTVKQYADVALAGLLKDEWGFPADHQGNPSKNAFWTSKPREADYARRTGGRDLVRDSLLMTIGEEGREAERQLAINHFMEQSRHRNSEIEHAVYTQTKATFGPDAFVGTHDTVYPYPDSREFERNGLNWWTATRDFGQTDEITPYSCRTSLAKKFGGAVWFNQWYSGTIEPYQKKIWSYALTGGRMNFHIIFPVPHKDYKEGGKKLLRTSVLRGDSRVRLLNNISDAPLDCPVAVVFGHAGVMNWAGPAFEDIGTGLTDAFWRAGFYADLIPTSEITNGSLRVDENGDVWYGKQRYAAVVLHQPEFENPSTAEFFRKAAKGGAILSRIGPWTKDFDAKPLDGGALLPQRMKLAADVETCAREVIAGLGAAGIEAQTPSSGEFHKWGGKGSTSIDMPAAGRSRLTDGTVILVNGEKDPTGDPIQKTIDINGHEVTFDALGVAAVRLSKDGKLEAMAAGGLTHFKTGSVEIRMETPADIALWKDEKGTWQGVLQGYEGDVPETLLALTPNWQRLAVVTPLDPPAPPAEPMPPSARSATASSQYDPTTGPEKANDGILAANDISNFWGSANDQDVGAWWQADMGEVTDIKGVQIQFRGLGGTYHFVPKSITFQVSDDGEKWTTALEKSQDVPANMSPYTGKMHDYPFDAKGRYVRLLFEEGTDHRVRNLKLVELVEVRILKAGEAAETPAAPATSSVDPLKIRLPADVPPVIGCWFWTPADGEPENFKPFLDGVAKHTAWNLVTMSIRIGNRHMTDPDVIAATREATAYGRTKGIGIVPELGFWSSFNQAYPNEPLQLMHLVTTQLSDQGEVYAETGYQTQWNHLQGWPFNIGPARVHRVYSYVRGEEGAVPESIEDITASCKVVEEKPGMLRIAIPCDKKTAGREASVLFSIDWQWPDIFNPKLPGHIRELLGKYKDTGIAGACLDEFGLPAFRKSNELWYSPHWVSAYAQRTGGRDLLRDMLLIVVGEQGRASERHGALNHYMEMTWQQHAKVEGAFYQATKDTFGPDAFVGTHPTWIPHLDDREIRRNGLDWWAVRRDFGQTDEAAPYAVRTALAKKWGGAVGYNMYYKNSISPYYNELWSTALAGLRVNYHPLYIMREDGRDWARKPLWSGDLMRGDSRVRMLNFISKTQLDCPVAVVFGHASATNWTGPGYANAGDALAEAFWRSGFYADLIPTSEIESGALRIDADGSVRYGDQRYAAVVLYHPEFEKPGTADFFRKAAKGGTALYRIGDWTKDFDGKPMDGNAALPREMTAVGDPQACIDQVSAKLRDAGIVPQTPAPARSGQSRLIDGTVILTAGNKDAAGDPIQKTIQIHGHDVTFDALGIAAVRLSKDGKLEAMAAGGLKHFKTGSFEIRMDTPADIALWKDGNGEWQGVLQDYAGDVPQALAAICKNWLRLDVPIPLR